MIPNSREKLNRKVRYTNSKIRGVLFFSVGFHKFTLSFRIARVTDKISDNQLNPLNLWQILKFKSYNKYLYLK
jgi:hypothetical protein